MNARKNKHTTPTQLNKLVPWVASQFKKVLLDGEGQSGAGTNKNRKTAGKFVDVRIF